MPKFVVNRYELHISRVLIEAKNKTDAQMKVLEGEGEELSCLYDSTPDEYIDRWTVEDVNGQ